VWIPTSQDIIKIKRVRAHTQIKMLFLPLKHHFRAI
jgi:hypothetical protein